MFSLSLYIICKNIFFKYYYFKLDILVIIEIILKTDIEEDKNENLEALEMYITIEKIGSYLILILTDLFIGSFYYNIIFLYSILKVKPDYNYFLDLK